MAGNFNIKNANGKTLTIQNPDTNNADIVIDGSKIASTVSPTFTGTPTVNGVSFSGYSGFKNYIINGGFDIWQRGTNFNSFGYTADRTTSSGDGTVSISKQTFSAGDTSVVGAENYYRFKRTAAGSGLPWNNAYIQYIEGLQRFAGKTLTISFWVKNSINSNIDIYIELIYGTGGSSTEYVHFTVPSTTSWTKVSRTFTVPTFSGKTFRGNNCMGINISPNYQVNSVYTLDIAQVQLEEGSVATPFEQRPYGLELSLCQRYYEVLGIGYGVAKDASSMILYFSASPKRIPPTGILLTSAPYGESPINIIARSATASTLATQMNQIVYGNGGYMCLVNGFNSMTANTNASINANSIALSAEL